MWISDRNLIIIDIIGDNAMIRNIYMVLSIPGAQLLRMTYSLFNCLHNVPVCNSIYYNFSM